MGRQRKTRTVEETRALHAEYRRLAKRRPHLERLPIARQVPVHQVFLSTTLPILGSYGFGVVVRRSL